MRVQIGELVIEDDSILFEITDGDGDRYDSDNKFTIDQLKDIIVGGKDWSEARLKVLSENHHDEIKGKNKIISEMQAEIWKLKRENESLSKKLMAKVLKMD